MKSMLITVLTMASVLIMTPRARADDMGDVKAAELAFNAAQNAGNIDGMFQYLLPGRTIFGPGGGRLGIGWTEEIKRRRQAEFDAGRKVEFKVEELEVRVFGDTAVTTFYRIGTVKELNEAAKLVHLRISGVWVRQSGGWKLAHRHESPF